ncbi:MAG: hypothetical protein L0Z70_04970 [Chloroflexi bacterium]|nr:hypothetical protein [Chloroflexota bacterium]
MEGRTRSSTATRRWFVQAALGALLLVLLGVHLVVNHLAAPQGLLSYAQVIRYYDMPGIPALEVAFLVVVTAHCLLGLHSLALEVKMTPGVRAGVAWLLAALGVGVVAYGMYLVWVVAAL